MVPSPCCVALLTWREARRRQHAAVRANGSFDLLPLGIVEIEELHAGAPGLADLGGVLHPRLEEQIVALGRRDLDGERGARLRFLGELEVHAAFGDVDGVDEREDVPGGELHLRRQPHGVARIFAALLAHHINVAPRRGGSSGTQLLFSRPSMAASVSWMARAASGISASPPPSHRRPTAPKVMTSSSLTGAAFSASLAAMAA